MTLAMSFLLGLLAVALTGCGSSSAPKAGGGGSANPPPDGTITVTFPMAATQQWIQQVGTGYISPVQSVSPPQEETLGGVSSGPNGQVILVSTTQGEYSGFSNPDHVAEVLLVQFDSTGKQLWLREFGTGRGDSIDGVASDASGNIYLTGLTHGAFPGQSNPTGAVEALVIKLDSSGNSLWVQQISLADSTYGSCIALDRQGNVLVGGSGQTTGKSTVPFVAKLSGTSGELLWTQGFDKTSAASVDAIAADSLGDIFIVGAATANFNDPAPSTTASAYVAKLSPSGQQLWVQQTFSRQAGNQLLALHAVHVDSQDNINVAGQFQTISANLTDEQTGLIYVAQLSNSSGHPVWQNQFGRVNQQLFGDMATTTNGDILIGFGDTTKATLDVLVAKLNSGGQGVWLQQFGTGKDTPVVPTSTSTSIRIASDVQENPVLAGITRGAFPGFNNPGASELFVSRFSP